MLMSIVLTAYNNIEDGLQTKNKALDGRTYLKKKRKRIKYPISEMEKGRRELLAKISVMDVLRSNFHVYRDMKEFETSLESHEGSAFAEAFPFELLEEAKTLEIQYLELIEEKEKKLTLFKSITGKDDTEEIRNLLKSNEEKLKRFYINISGLKEKISDLKNNMNEASLSKENIVLRMRKANSAGRKRLGVY